MSASTTLTAAEPAPVDIRSRRSWRRTKDGIATGAMVLAVLVVAVPLFAVIYTVLKRGLSIVFGDFPAFFTDDIPIRSREVGPGMKPAIIGTLIITFTAAVIAIPLGVLGAVYLNEYGKQSRPARFLRFLSYVMTGVPSIVMGLFVALVFTVRYGLSGLGGAIALACLMLPIVIRSVEEMLKLVPDHLREASYALGTSRSRTVVTVVLPAALAGIVSGCLLAVARAAGETAPLVFTIGVVSATNPNVLSGANTALSAQIFTNAKSAFVGANERAWGAALVLIGITFIFTILARVVSARFALKR